MQRFKKKVDAVSYLNKNKNDNKLRVFGEDLSSDGHKSFIVCYPELIYKNIINNDSNHYYEYFLDNAVIFGIDLDIDSSKISYKDTKDLLRITILKVIASAKQTYKFDYNINDFIILENDIYYQNPDKYSYHIVCRGLKFENGTMARDFFNITDKKYNLKYCDYKIYNNCLRLCFCSKMGKESVLLPSKLELECENTFYLKENSNNDEIYNYWLKTLITNTDDSRMTINAVKKYIKKIDEPNEKAPDPKDIKNILYKLPCEYYNDFELWVRIGMMLCNSGFDFEVWNKWSKQSHKYDEKRAIKQWASFEQGSNKKLTVGSLIYLAIELGIIKKKKTIEEIIKTYPEKPVKIDSKNATILNQAKLTNDTFKDILTNKLVAVQSEKGTGKTSNLLEVLFKSKMVNDKTRILILSSRRTLGIKFLGDLDKYGFKLYSEIEDSDIRDKRIICQIDSISRLQLAKYDIIIVDECESMARYLSSSHFKKNNKALYIINKYEYYIKNANNVYILDADLSDRCMIYYNKLIKNDNELINKKLIINTFKPYSHYKITSMEYELWLVKIMDYLKNDKKIVIAMTSNNKAKDLLICINNNYPDKKVLIIHRETTDDEKMDSVKNVNEKWSEYDIIIYTPSVNMGISYDVVDYFDAIFGYGCHGSVGAQEFTQMLHRVRHPKEKNIFVSIDLYQEYKDDDVLTYKDVQEILCTDYYLTKYDLHTNLMAPKPRYDQSKETMVLEYPYSNEPIYDLIVRNTWEEIENKQNFSNSFYGYVKFKGYQLEYNMIKTENSILEEMKSIREIRVGNEAEINTNGILEAKELTEEEYIELISQRENYLADEDRYAIRKYNIRKCYHKYDELDEEFLREYNDNQKMMWYKNMSNIVKTDNQSTDNKICILQDNQVNNTWNDNCYLDLTSKNIYTYHKYVIDIIESLNFDINELDNTISEGDFEKNMKKCTLWLDNIKDTVFMHFNIKLTKKRLVDLDMKEQLKYINKIINGMYGLNIKKINKNYQMIDNKYWENHNIIPVDI